MQENEIKVGDEVLIDGNGTMTGRSFRVEEIDGDMVWMSNEDGGEYCAPVERITLY
jgi:hypothetical protein